ncbi:MAG: hypothetical protein H0W63_04125 [Gemmatimonadaceae bacterium]|nr:hypothetical protein [Gemmatimonadaceae bacterium]
MSDFPRKPYLAPQHASAAPESRARFAILPPYLHGRSVSQPVEALPSIDEFLDDAPPIEQFAPVEHAATAATEWSWGGKAPVAAAPPPREQPVADWQSFDWGSAARLGNAPPDAAAEAWASTDWSEPAESQESRQSAAEALARALDQISRRIRAGELSVPGPGTVQDDAAIAATLAALLGIRR